MRSILPVLLLFCLSSFLYAQETSYVTSFNKSKVKARTHSLGLYAEEGVSLSLGGGIHANTTFPFASGLCWRIGNNVSNNMIECSLGYQLRRNRNFYHVHNLETSICFVREFKRVWLPTGWAGLSAGVYGLFPLSSHVDRTFPEVGGLHEAGFNNVVGFKVALCFQIRRFGFEEIFKLGTPYLNATKLSFYTRDYVDVSIDYILAFRVTYALFSNSSY